MAIIGPGGAGKTYTSLLIASELGQKVALIDTEHGSASKYADLFDFDVIELDSFGPQTYTAAIRALEAAGYDVIVIDSLSHAWTGKDGALEQVNKVQVRDKSTNSFTAWRDITPLHNEMVEAIVSSNAHILATMRVKTEYVMEEYQNKSGGKSTKPVKVGLAPIQRDGLEYEFDVIAEVDWENNFVVGKTRCPALSQFVTKRAGKDVALILKDWLQGAPPPPKPELRADIAARIQELVNETTFDMSDTFKRAGVDEIKYFTPDQATKLIAFLEKRQKEQQAEASAKA